MSIPDYATVNQTIDEINVKEEDPLAVFTEDFMQACSEFETFTELIDESPWTGDYEYFSASLTVEDFNDFIAENTTFNSWPEMLNEALDSYWSESESNRREYPRYSCEKEAVIEQGNNQFRGKIKDVSKNGMCLRTPSPLKESRLTHVKFNPGEDTLREIGGIIRWNTKIDNSSFESGLEITRKE